MVIVDTSALLAYFDSSEDRHVDVAAVLDRADPPFVVSPYVVAELDYLLLKRKGQAAERATLREIANEGWRLAAFPPDLFTKALELIESMPDQAIGIADASLIVLAEANRTRTIVTLDRRHFSVLRFSDRSAPELLP